MKGVIDRVVARIDAIKDYFLRFFVVRLLVASAQALGADNGADMAAAMAYYAFLSFFPLLLGLTALFALFLPSEQVQRQLFDFFQRNFPFPLTVLQENVTEVIRLRGTVGVLGMLGLFWSATAMFDAVSRTINRAFDVGQERAFYLGKLQDFGMAFGIGLLFVLSLGATAILNVLGSIGLPGSQLMIDLGSWAIPFLMSLGVFLLLYKFVPNREVDFAGIWPGALVGAVLFEMAKNGFVFYLKRLANYQSVYGSLASGIVLLVWIYVSMLILILGAELTWQYITMRRKEAG